MRNSEVAAYLLRFKYTSRNHPGLCHELGVTNALIENGGRDWKPDGAHGTARGTSNPVLAAVIGAEERLPRLFYRRDELEEEIGHVGSVLLRVEHGGLLDAYYLQDSYVSWSEVFEDFGLPERTGYDRVDKALSQLAMRRGRLVRDAKAQEG